MSCFSPLTGYRSLTVNSSGKRPIVFNPSKGFKDLPVEVPCGRCIGCRLDKSRQWATRCMHEAQTHDSNSFITLTFDNDNLPADNSIRKEHLQKFFKRLRKRTGIKLRYFACGEYGEKNTRPHYHAIIFGYDFPDKVLHDVRDGYHYYISDVLSAVWPYGFHLIGSVTFESCAYVARYVMKKRLGDPDSVDKDGISNKDHYKYTIVDSTTGEMLDEVYLEPEFCLMSRRPGIGRSWYEQFKGDLEKDYITIQGRSLSIPKYYDSIMEVENVEQYQLNKARRLKFAKQNAQDNTTERLSVKETVKKQQINFLKRGLDQ